MSLHARSARFLAVLVVTAFAACLCGCPKAAPPKKDEPIAPKAETSPKPEAAPKAEVEPKAAKTEAEPKAAKADLSDAKSDRENALVKSEGAGATRDEALRDAFRNAVRQVVGTFVDEETRTQNDEVISDKVLTYSDGIVTEYQERDVTEKGGIWRAKITARVERGKVVARLQAAKVAVKDVDGTGLFAEIVSDLEKSKSAAGTIDKALGRFPLDCMTATLEGKPEVVDKSETGATVRLQIRVSADLKAYDSMAAKLVKTLDAVKKEGGELTLVAKDAHPQNARQFGSTHEFPRDAGIPRKPRANDEPQPLTVQVNISRTKDFKRQEWRTFEVDESAHSAFALRSLSVLGVKTTIVDKGGRAVVTDRFPMAVRYQPVSLLSYGHGEYFRDPPEGLLREEYRGALHRSNSWPAIVAPFFALESRFSRGNFATYLRFTRDIKLSLDEIKAIHNVRVELTFPGTYPPKPPEPPK